MKKYIEYTTRNVNEILSDKAKLSLYKKSASSDIPVSVLEEVYRRGYYSWKESFGNTPDQFAFDRVNSFIAGGFARQLDEDLAKACWKGYEAVGMKKKNGKKVPNCVPVKEQLNAPLPSTEKIAKKFDKSASYIKSAIKSGSKVEKEHTKDQKTAEKIAKAHVNERPDYYKKLKKVGLEEDAEKHSKDFRKPSSRFIGSEELTDIYKDQTPGQIIKKVIREHLQEVAMSMPPQIEPPVLQRQAPQRQYSRSVQTQGRLGSGSGAMRGGVQIQRAAPASPPTARMAGPGGTMKTTTTNVPSRAAAPRAPTSSMPSGQAGSMTAKPTVTRGIEATKYTIGKGMSDAGKAAAEKAASSAVGSVAGRAAGGLLRAATGPAATAAAMVMEPKPAGEKKSEFQRQADVAKGISYKPQGRSISQYEKDVFSKSSTSEVKPETKIKADVPTPPTRPEHFTFGSAFQSAREKAGGSGGSFEYTKGSGETGTYHTGVKGETVPKKLTPVETESGKTVKKIKEAISEATYKGKSVPLNKPMKGDVKKSKVYVDPDGDGKAQKVNFGDKNMSIKKDQPARKKSYCARSSGQGNLNDKTSANYWSRKAWNCEETEVIESKLINLTDREAHKLLSDRGWSVERHKGGHTVFGHPRATHKIAVPKHRGNLSPGIARKIHNSSKVD